MAGIPLSPLARAMPRFPPFSRCPSIAFRGAARTWPGMFRDERRALKAMARRRGTRLRAFAAIDKATRRFYVSAYQSYLFNLVVAARVGEGLNRLWEGDLAWLHASGAVFHVDDPVAEQPRADAFEMMAEHAEEMGANAVIGVRYDTTEIMQGVTEVLCYGTAVITEPVSA